MSKRSNSRVAYIRTVPRAAVVGGVFLLAAAAWFVGAAPAVVTFTVAVVIAIAWCIWLERHPEATNMSEDDVER